MPEMEPTPEEEAEFCQKIFSQEVKRDEDGRYQVPLFVRPNNQGLGNSYDIAVRNFLRLEKSLTKNDSKRMLVNEFMQEYLSMGHMSLVPEKADTTGETYYVPYHPIFKPDKLTTKCRNVFNFSAKTSNGVSLNNILFMGPNLLIQSVNGLTGMRTFSIAVTADIEKMYRQINLLTNYKKYQRIVWRTSESEVLSEYELNTVTYGVNCAPALALLVLEDISQKAPKDVQNALKGKFYMDDWLHGANTPEEPAQVCRKVFDELQKAGMTLRKFASNNNEALSMIPKQHHVEAVMGENQTERKIKILGYIWNTEEDTLAVPIPKWDPKTPLTKRKLLSYVASFYDPLGLLLLVAVLLRLFMQKTWSLKIEWDEKVPKLLADQFAEIYLSIGFYCLD